METEELKKGTGPAEETVPQIVESDWEPGGADSREPQQSPEASASGTAPEAAASESETPAEAPEEPSAAAESAAPQVPDSPEGEPRAKEGADPQAETDAAAIESEAKEEARPAPAAPAEKAEAAEAAPAETQEAAEEDPVSGAAPGDSGGDALPGAALPEAEAEDTKPRGLAPQESLEQVLASIRRRFSRKTEPAPESEAKPIPSAGRTTLAARALLTREQAIGAALALSAAAAAAFGAWCWTKGAEEPLPPIEREDPLLTSKRTLSLPPLAELREQDEKAGPAEEASAPEPAPSPEPRPAPRTVFVPSDVREAARAASRPAEPTLSELRLASPLTLGTPSGHSGLRGSAAGTARASAFSSEKDEDGLFAGKKTADARARVKADRSLRIAKGTAIECVLETRLDTSVPGLASCVLPQDVWSEDGRVLLLEKGSKAVGEYRGAAANGLSRIFLLWTRIVTPAGVAIDLDSPAADPLGGAGIEGSADFHWWERFGNALLFSLVQDAFDFGIARETEAAGGVNYYSSTTDSMTELVKEAMKQAGNIPPTITKPQGSRITVIAARDLDFRDAYAIEPERGEEER